MSKRFTWLVVTLIFFGAIGTTMSVASGQEQQPPAPPPAKEQPQVIVPPPVPPSLPAPAAVPPPAPSLPPGQRDGTTAASPLPPAPPPPAPPVASSSPILRQILPGIFEIGNCTIIKAENKVEFPAAINMKEGLLEYLLVGNTGKLHESLLKTDVEPYSLQLALLLSGLEGSLSPLSDQGENRVPEGDAVEIMLRWQENGKERKARIEEFVLKSKEAAGEIPWVFTGSMVRNGVFAAQVDKSLIAVYHDPVALIDHRLPEGANDEVWTVNSQATPAIGTAVTVIITKKNAPPTLLDKGDKK